MTAFLVQSNTFAYILMAVAAIVMLIFFVVVFSAMYFIIKRKERRQGNDWANAARQLGLQLKPATNEMLGDFDKMRNKLGGQAKIEGTSAAQTMFGNFSGRMVEVVIRQTQSSDFSAARLLEDSPTRVQKKFYATCCEAAFASRNGLEFQIKSRNGGNIFSRAIAGGGDLQIGYPPFDQSFIVSGNDVQKIYQILCTKAEDKRTVAERFAANFNNDWIIEASAGKIVVKFPAKVTNPAALAPALQAATELALRLELALAK